MTDPYVTPRSDLAGQEGQDLERIRRGQKLVIYSFLLMVIGWEFAPIPEDPNIILWAIGMLSIVGVVGMWIYGLVALCKGMKTPTWLLVLIGICWLIPFINLLVLLAVNGHATKALRTGGFKVGLMGASPRVA